MQIFPMLTMRNIQFTRLLKTGGRFREFNFRRSSNDGITVFFIDVTDDRNNRVQFRMQKENGSWKLFPQVLPEWISTSESNLAGFIDEEFHE